MELPTMRPASETEWWGSGRGGCSRAPGWWRQERSDDGALLMEWMVVTSRASSKEREGRMETIRLASIVSLDPGGPATVVQRVSAVIRCTLLDAE
jgi:hypothetical protein